MDYDDNLVAKYSARQARIRQIQDLLTNAVVGEDPPDDGIAEPGMVLTVRYDDTGEIETFLLGVRGVKTPTSTCTRCNHRWAARSPAPAPANSAPTPSPVGPTCPSRFSRRCPTECTRRNPRGTVPPTATHQRPSASHVQRTGSEQTTKRTTAARRAPAAT